MATHWYIGWSNGLYRVESRRILLVSLLVVDSLWHELVPPWHRLPRRLLNWIGNSNSLKWLPEYSVRDLPDHTVITEDTAERVLRNYPPSGKNNRYCWERMRFSPFKGWGKRATWGNKSKTRGLKFGNRKSIDGNIYRIKKNKKIKLVYSFKTAILKFLVSRGIWK